jgi:hypothetical protein
MSSVAQYAILKHEVESGQQLYDTLQLKLKEAGITSGLASSYVSIVDRAQDTRQAGGTSKAALSRSWLRRRIVRRPSFGADIRFLRRYEFGRRMNLTAVTALPELSSVPFSLPFLASKVERNRHREPVRVLNRS